MPNHFKKILTIFAITLGSQVNAATVNMLPGLWEIQLTVPIAGKDGAKINATNTNKRCIRENDIETPANITPFKNDHCKVSAEVIDPNSLEWTMQCSGAKTVTGNGHIVLDGDHYHGTMIMVTNSGGQEQRMTTEVIARRVGNCVE